MDGVADNYLCHLLTRLNCRGHKGTFIFTYLGPTYELSIVKIADAVVNRNSLWGQRCLFQLSLPISSINMNKKLQPVRATFSGNSQCNKSSSCIGRAIFFFIFVLKIGRSSYKKNLYQGLWPAWCLHWWCEKLHQVGGPPRRHRLSPVLPLYEVRIRKFDMIFGLFMRCIIGQISMKEMGCIRNFDKRPLDKIGLSQVQSVSN